MRSIRFFNIGRGCCSLFPVNGNRCASPTKELLKTLSIRLRSALGALTAQIGTEPGSLAPISVDDLISDDELEAIVPSVLESSSRVADSRRAMEAAETQYATTDNALSSQVEIEAAPKRVEKAAGAPANSLATANAALSAQTTRLEVGTISALAFSQSEFALQAVKIP